MLPFARRITRLTILTTVIVCICVLLSSCARNEKETGLPEQKIRDSIIEEDNYISSYKLSVKDFEITKRQTNPEDKTDFVWASISASNYDYTYYADYYLSYVLYNDGWLLEESELLSEHYEINHPETITQKMADDQVDLMGYDSFAFDHRNNNLHGVQFSYTAVKYAYYQETQYRVIVKYSFFPSSGWSFDEVSDNITSRRLDVLGEWSYRDEERELYINIIDISDNNTKITWEYNVSGEDITDERSYGPITSELGGDTNKGEYGMSIDSWNDYGLLLGKEHLLTHGGAGAGVKVNGYWLTKKASTPDAVNQSETKLVIAGQWETCPALEVVADLFQKKYPDCQVEYQYFPGYDDKDMAVYLTSGTADLFFALIMYDGSQQQQCALDILSRNDIDLSGTFPGLTGSSAVSDTLGGSAQLYSVPVGAEMRGMYVNVTLLNSLGIDVPTDQASLLAACRTLKENGYIAFHGFASNFGQMLLYPWICSNIANADDPAATYEQVNSRKSGISELFREPYEFLYTLIENGYGYFDYTKAQNELGLFLDGNAIAQACDFLNVRCVDDGYIKNDDIGQAAFLPSTLRFRGTIDKISKESSSNIEYRFIAAPVGVDGGYAYISPSFEIAINKNSANIDWAARFMDFIMQPENNKAFAEAFDLIPNTADAADYIATRYDVPHDRQSSSIVFDYNFYRCVNDSLVEITRSNVPKYMQTDADGNVSMYPLEYYMERLDARLAGKTVK